MDMEKMEEVTSLFGRVVDLKSKKEELTRLCEVLDTEGVHGEIEVTTPRVPIYSGDEKKYAFIDYDFEITEENKKHIVGLIEVEIEELDGEVEAIDRMLYLMGVDI